MALSLSSARVCTPCRTAAPWRTRARTVQVKALSLQEASNWFAQSFVRIFSPNDSKVENWPAGSYDGKINRARKPFKDGFSSNAEMPPSAALEREPTGQARPQAPHAAGYVEEAMRGVVSGLKPEVEGEPKWSGATTAWRGEVHQSDNKRDAREGFHNKKF